MAVSETVISLTRFCSVSQISNAAVSDDDEDYCMSLVLAVVVLETMNSVFLVSWSGCATMLVSSDDIVVVCVCARVCAHPSESQGGNLCRNEVS